MSRKYSGVGGDCCAQADADDNKLFPGESSGRWFLRWRVLRLAEPINLPLTSLAVRTCEYMYIHYIQCVANWLCFLTAHQHTRGHFVSALQRWYCRDGHGSGRSAGRIGSDWVGSGHGSASRQIWRVGSGRNFWNALFCSLSEELNIFTYCSENWVGPLLINQ